MLQNNKLKILFTLLVIFSVIFYFYRLHIEYSNKKVSYFMEYSSFLNYYNNENKEITAFLKILKDNYIDNILILPSTIANLLNEYNDITLAKGSSLNIIYNNNKFQNQDTYLCIPLYLKNINLQIGYYNRTFEFNNYLIYEFDKNLNFINNLLINFIHKYENNLGKNNFSIIKIKNKYSNQEID